MNRVICLDEDLCPKNHHCPAVRVCPVYAMSQASPYNAPEINIDKCILCGKCIKICPTNALFTKLPK